MKHIKVYWAWILLSLFILGILGCKEGEKSEAEKIIKEWTGKTILFPENLSCKWFDKDTICPDLLNKPYKLLIYVDSIGCIDCKLRLSIWKDFISEINLEHFEKVGFLFFFTQRMKKN
jgi:hypothetical protein